MSTTPDDQGTVPQEEDQIRALQLRELEFYGDQLTALLSSDRQIYIHFARLTDCLGLDLTGQLEQVRGNKVLAAGLRSFTIPTVRGPRPAQFLRLGVLAFYLARIQIERVREELRQKLERYQSEAADVLADAFLGELGLIDRQDLTPAEQAYHQAQLMANIARQQMIFERDLGGAYDQLEGQKELLVDHDERLAALEVRLGSNDRITEEQATEIKEAVKAVAVLAKKLGVKEWTFPAVWGHVYRTFSVTVYRNIPRPRFPEVIQCLEELKRTVLGADV